MKYDKWTEAMISDEEPSQEIIDEVERRKNQVDKERPLPVAARWREGSPRMIDTKQAGLDII